VGGAAAALSSASTSSTVEQHCGAALIATPCNSGQLTAAAGGLPAEVPQTLLQSCYEAVMKL